MTVSGTKLFELDVTEYIEEAFERCGLEVRTGYDMKSAKRSLNIMLAEWANRGLNQWTIQQVSVTVTQGTAAYSLGADTIDILSAVVQRDGVDYGISRVSRDDFLNIPDKTSQSRISQFYVDRQITPSLKVWPTPDNSTDVIIYNRLVRLDDAGAAANTLEIPFRFYPALSAGLAYYISLKRAPQRTQILKAVYEEELERAMAEDRDRASFQVAPSLEYYRMG
jgi:hypothetical protein|tara:strand:- start:1181 stop:1849 length:669 start_codon:yes stop_codon:yes gene_type:complete